MTLSIASFLLVFSVPITMKWARGRAEAAAWETPFGSVPKAFVIMSGTYFAVCSLTVFLFLGLYLRYDRRSAGQWYERQRAAGKHVRAWAASLPGLALQAQTWGLLLLFLVVPRVLPGLLAWNFWSLWSALLCLCTLILAFTHSVFQFPNAESFLETTETLLAIAVPLVLGITAFGPFFVLDVPQVAEEHKSAHGALILIAALALCLALRWLLRVEWRILPRILVWAGVLLGVDLLLAGIGHLLVASFG